MSESDSDTRSGECGTDAGRVPGALSCLPGPHLVIRGAQERGRCLTLRLQPSVHRQLYLRRVTGEDDNDEGLDDVIEEIDDMDNDEMGQD